MATTPLLAVEIGEFLREEHATVLIPLLRKMDRIADRLEEGEAVTVDEVRAGLGLWSQYFTRIRAPRIRELFGAFPTSEEIPACASRIRELREQQILEDRRIPSLERMLEYYSTGQFGGRAMLTGMLRGATASARAWAEYEEEYAAHCLVRAISPQAQTAGEEALRKAREALRDLATEVGRYVAPPATSVRMPSSPTKAPA